MKKVSKRPTRCGACMTALILFLIAVTSSLVWWVEDSEGATFKSPHCVTSCPSFDGFTNNTLIHRADYVLSNNPFSKYADWVAYKVNRKNFGPSRKRNWKADPDLPENETLEPEDYTGAHALLATDRGHQVPLASFSGTRHWKELNYLSNITPQASALNQGPWMRLESKVRELANKTGYDYYVMTGPVLSRNLPTLPNADEDTITPIAYWKIVVLKHNGKLYAAAFFLYQNAKRDANFCEAEVKVTSVEYWTGLSFNLGDVEWLGSLCSKF